MVRVAMVRMVPVLVVAVVLAACGGAASPSASGSVASSGTASASVPGESASGGAAATPSASPAAGAVVGGIAQVSGDRLNLRPDPGTGAGSLGNLPAGERVYVNAGPVAAEGYDWYQVASVRQPYRGDCGDPAPAPSLECSTYFGWVAAADTNGTPWLEDAAFACPDGRDVAAYLAMLPAERLACAGNEEWTLRAYVPPMEGGRGCLPAYVVTPDWLDGSCNFTFLQREEREDDAFEGLQVFLSPELGACTGFNGEDCPFTALKGSWVSVQGHLDDPAASTCEAVPSDLVPAPDDPPDPDAVIFGCRLAFVVTAISPEA